MRIRIPLFVRVLPAYVLILVIFLLPYIQERTHIERITNDVRAYESAISTEQTVAESAPLISYIEGRPIRIVVPQHNIDLPIVDGTYNSATEAWSVSDTKANYASITPKANNQSGKTVIYGHNNRYVFARLLNLKSGDHAYLYTDSGRVFKYIFNGSKTVEPTDTQIFDQLDGEPGLKLMTCSGAWYQNRTIMDFSMESAL